MLPSESQPRRSARGVQQVEEILDLLYRRRWLIAITFLLCGLLAAAYALTRTPVYRTSALVLVDLDRKGGAGGVGESPTAPDLFVRDSRTVQTELFVLNASRGIRERVQERLESEYGRVPPGSVSFSLADRNVSSGIQISATSTSPEAAAALANAHAIEYVAQTQISSRSYLTSTREFLQEQADRLRGEVTSADAKVAGRMSSAGAASLGNNALLSQLSSLESALSEAQIDRQMRVNRLQSIEDQLNDITPHLADRMGSDTDRRISTIEREITEQEGRLRTFQEREARGAAIDEAAARAIRTRLASLERQKAELGERYINEVMGAGGIAAPAEALSYVNNLQNQAAQERIELSGLDGRIGQLRSRIGQVSSELGRAPSEEISLERASQDRQTASSAYSSVAEQLQKMRVLEASEPGYARILREAPVPWLPDGPGWLRTLALGLGMGLGLGVALAFAKDKLDNRIYKPEHVAALGLPVLEVVPDMDAVVEDILGGAETIRVGDHEMASQLVTIHAPLSPASEVYRHLRTAIQFSRPDTVVQTLLVTSAGAGEGKSTTASNLAAAFAQAGRSTVIIDADLRRPRLHEEFGVPAGSGLFQFVQRGLSEPDDIRQALEPFRVGVDNLFVVPAGGAAGDDQWTVPNPAEVLGSPEIRALLDGLRKVVDVIVLDSPPVLAATDAVLLSTQADATLFVTSSGLSKSGDIQQAVSHLDDVGAKVIGAVLNRFSLDNAFGYAYTYGHYSKYGAYSKYGPYTKDTAPAKKKKKGKFSAKPSLN
ncbi:polysaccharide biosynthesis tyrosine autokinase [Rubrivirga sp.]|uniref:polysaccharide biosynthesis tyrosine autokinase n=1 Tax=Rubrivirga sp. TaxID=1885344 RepID=UPI003B52748B